MFKKALAMLLCILVVLSMATVTFAADTRITVQAENATDKTLDLENRTDVNGKPMDHSTRTLGENGYHYSDGWGTSVINICSFDTYTYTFNVETAGTYNFGFKGGTDRDIPFNIYVDNSETKEANAPVAAPGNWPFTEPVLHTLHLTKGTHTFKLTITENKNHNVAADYFFLDLVEADPEPTPDPVEVKEILKGTPTVDGKLDEAYKSSLKLTVDQSAVIWVPKADPDTVSAEVYFLHDGEYLYICGVVTGDSKVVNTNPQKPEEWAVDGLDIWFLMPELPLRTKFTMDAFALPYGTSLQTKEQEWSHNIDVSKITKAAVIGDGSYVVEAKIPVPYYMESEKSLAINVQLNNVYDAEVNSAVANYNCGFYGKQYKENEIDATMAVLSDTAASGGTGDTGNEGPSETGDSIAVVVALLAVSAMGIAVVTGKKKEF